MKKLLLFTFILFLSVVSFASEYNNRTYLGIEGGYYSYREPHMEYPIRIHTDDKIGVSLEFISRGVFAMVGFNEEDDKSFAAIDLRYVTGKTDYDGYLWNGDPHYAKGEKDWYGEGRITFGEVWDLGGVVEFWPYLGFGYRYLVNDGSKVDSSSYKRVSQYYYMPIGTKIYKSFGGFAISLTGEFDWLLYGEQASKLGNIIPELESDYLYNSQTKGFGARFGVKVEIPLTQKVGLFIEPYYRMWKIQNSRLATSEVTQSGNTYHWWYGIPIIEPFNTTRERGIRAGIYF